VQKPFITPSEAAVAASVTPRCVTLWCRKVPGLGHRVVGRWRVDPVALERLLTPAGASEGADRDNRA